MRNAFYTFLHSIEIFHNTWISPHPAYSETLMLYWYLEKYMLCEMIKIVIIK